MTNRYSPYYDRDLGGCSMELDEHGSWVHVTTYDALAASCSQAAKDAVQFQDERDRYAARLAEAERLLSDVKDVVPNHYHVSRLAVLIASFLRAADSAEPRESADAL